MGWGRSQAGGFREPGRDLALWLLTQDPSMRVGGGFGGGRVWDDSPGSSVGGFQRRKSWILNSLVSRWSLGRDDPTCVPWDKDFLGC